ncbi:ABC transporter permease subunit, partial [Microcoleus sp.]|uniref:ABC transporter permease subunit n=1 Tax=Microcoleus sp. TaxID=44472 RepID=UPI00403E4FFB
MTRPLTPANKTLERSASTWQDGLLILAIFSLILAIVQTASQFSSDYNPNFKIETTLNVLPAYTAQTLLRMASAYFLSLLFTLVYAYSAYRFPLAAKILIPLLDILQSIPVLSFLPGVVLALVTLFPGQRIGVELASIILIFTGMTWNMTFSFYQSLSGIPQELKEAAQVYRLNAWQQFWTLELPAGAIGLVWNSVMSVAGGWFFLIAIESFTLGDKNFNLPGLGSYLGKAANEGNFLAIGWGLAVLIGVIIAIDFFIWQPLIAWVEKFKYQSVEATDVPQSNVLDFLRRSATLRVLKSRISPLGDSFDRALARGFAPANLPTNPRQQSRIGNWINWIFVSGFAVIVLWGTWEAVLLLRLLSLSDWQKVMGGAFFTALRVICALFLSLLWTVPLGVAIGRNPRLAQILQPLVQIAASVPATALFPVLLLALIKTGGGLE